MRSSQQRSGDKRDSPINESRSGDKRGSPITANRSGDKKGSPTTANAYMYVDTKSHSRSPKNKKRPNTTGKQYRPLAGRGLP